MAFARILLLFVKKKRSETNPWERLFIVRCVGRQVQLIRCYNSRRGKKELKKSSGDKNAFRGKIRGGEEEEEKEEEEEEGEEPAL